MQSRKMFPSFLIGCFLSLSAFTASAQLDSLPAEDWDAYLSQFKKQTGSITLNMALKKVAPVAGYPFLVISNVRFLDCNKQGLPSPREYDNLVKISDSVLALLKQSTPAIAAGSYTILCERLEYFYVKDTAAVRERMNTLFKNRFTGYTLLLQIKEDKEWSTYLKFLYPKDETLEIMANQKIIARMQKAGDMLQRSRPVDHFAYFKTEADRNCFIAAITKKKLAPGAKETTTDFPGYPYKLAFTQLTSISLSSMSKMTFELKRQAALCYGKYDGWETVIVK